MKTTYFQSRWSDFYDFGLTIKTDLQQGDPFVPPEGALNSGTSPLVLTKACISIKFILKL